MTIESCTFFRAVDLLKTSLDQFDVPPPPPLPPLPYVTGEEAFGPSHAPSGTASRQQDSGSTLLSKASGSGVPKDGLAFIRDENEVVAPVAPLLLRRLPPIVRSNDDAAAVQPSAGNAGWHAERDDFHEAADLPRKQRPRGAMAVPGEQRALTDAERPAAKHSNATRAGSAAGQTGRTTRQWWPPAEAPPPHQQQQGAGLERAVAPQSLGVVSTTARQQTAASRGFTRRRPPSDATS